MEGVSVIPTLLRISQSFSWDHYDEANESADLYLVYVTTKVPHNKWGENDASLDETPSENKPKAK